MALRLAYAFDETSGSAFAEASGGPAGTVVSGSFTTGHTGNALTVASNALAGRVGNTPGAPALLGDGDWAAITIMFWIKCPSLTSHPLGIETTAGGRTDHFGSEFTTTQFRAWLYINTGFVQAGPTNHGVSAGTWMHVAMTWSGATDQLKVYVDGSLLVTQSAVGTHFPGSMNYIQVGKVAAGWAVAPQQPMDDLRFFDSLEDATSITTYMNTPVPAAAATSRPPRRRLNYGALLQV